MPTHFIPINLFERLLEILRSLGRLDGPIKGEDGTVRFAPLPPGVMPDLDAVRTRLPPKKYLLYPQEVILTYHAGKGYQTPDTVNNPIILCGLHPCDLAGIDYLDHLFLGCDPDPWYASHRSQLTLIGTSCSPDEFCSCHIHHSPLKAAYDIFLLRIEGGFAVSSGSARGLQLMQLLHEIIEERDLDLPEDSRRFFGQQQPPPSTVELDPALPEWQELAKHCLGCGACSICCPTCSCFDVLELGGLEKKSADRVRCWDNCLYKSHSRVAGGMIFQKDRPERFRYRYRHKYRGFGPLLGIPGCVGCGRCRAFCPAGLDLRQLALQLEKVEP